MRFYLLEGRNRFRFRSQNLPSTSETPTTEAAKPKSRFSRPSASSGGYGGRSRSTAAPTAAAASSAEVAEKETVNEEEVKPVTTSSFGRQQSRSKYLKSVEYD